MKVYILVANDKGNSTTNMPIDFGRAIRAYHSKARAHVYARKFKCAVVELELGQGKIVIDETVV